MIFLIVPSNEVVVGQHPTSPLDRESTARHSAPRMARAEARPTAQTLSANDEFVIAREIRGVADPKNKLHFGNVRSESFAKLT
jgi:hypothetical protein